MKVGLQAHERGVTLPISARVGRGNTLSVNCFIL